MLVKTSWVFIFSLFLAVCGQVMAQGANPVIKVEVFEGEFPSVNSFILSNGKTIIVIDVQRTSESAKKLADRIKDVGLPLTHVFISHGHTDHFMGLAVFKQQFPKARIAVHNEAIKKDIKDYATWMNSGGWLDDEPTMKPLSPDYLSGFDYENAISVLKEDKIKMVGGGVLLLTSDYMPTEGEHMTTVYIPENNALFLADFGYNKVHLWMGEGVSAQHIKNWRDELLHLKAVYAKTNPLIYPGHGSLTDISLFDAMVEYIDNFQKVVKGSKSTKVAIDEMVKLYPEYAEADFLLKYSVLHHMKD